MGTAIAVGFWGGVVLLFVFTPFAARMHRNYRRLWHAAASAMLTCAQLRETDLRQVAVVARTSEWDMRSWTELTIHHWEPNPHDKGTFSHSVTSKSTKGRIVIKDDTGTALLAEELAIRSLTLTSNPLAATTHRKWNEDDDSNQFHETTWQVARGVPVFVIGSLTHDDDGTPRLYCGGSGMPGDPRSGGTSTDAPDVVVARLIACDSRWAGIAGTSALIGLSVTSIALVLTILGMR